MYQYQLSSYKLSSYHLTVMIIFTWCKLICHFGQFAHLIAFILYTQIPSLCL